MDLELIEAHRDIDKLMPYLHLPVQSGSDKILKMMNRKHSSIEYIKVIEKIRDYNPKIAISGDFIIGFPGETDNDHQATLDLIKEINYSQAYSFKYSSRPGTPAVVFFNHVDESIKSSRLQEVQDLLKLQQMEFNRKSINSTLNVLVLKNGKKNKQYLGRSPFNQSIYFNSDDNNLIGSTIDINVTEAFQNSLTGIIKPYKNI
jgi:tRNA-2-methylthio-N6-dimethylallyladenosine synthase